MSDPGASELAEPWSSEQIASFRRMPDWERHADVDRWLATLAAALAAPAPDLLAAVEALQRAVERLGGVGADLHWRSVDDARRWSDAVNVFGRKSAAVLALIESRSTSREAGLDVERLARALATTEVGCWATGAYHDPKDDERQHRRDAEAIAAEYARLATSPVPTEEEG